MALAHLSSLTWNTSWQFCRACLTVESSLRSALTLQCVHSGPEAHGVITIPGRCSPPHRHAQPWPWNVARRSSDWGRAAVEAVQHRQQRLCSLQLCHAGAQGEAPPACPSVGEGLNICEASLNDKMPHTCDAITMIDESPVPWKSSRRSRFSLHISVTDATALHMHFQLSTAPL